MFSDDSPLTIPDHRRGSYSDELINIQGDDGTLMRLYLYKPGNGIAVPNKAVGGSVKEVKLKEVVGMAFPEKLEKSKNGKSRRVKGIVQIKVTISRSVHRPKPIWKSLTEKLTVFSEERTLPFLDPSPMGPAAICLCNCNTGKKCPYPSRTIEHRF